MTVPVQTYLAAHRLINETLRKWLRFECLISLSSLSNDELEAPPMPWPWRCPRPWTCWRPWRCPRGTRRSALYAPPPDGEPSATPQWLYRERGRRADPPLASSQCYSAARASTVSTFGGGVCRRTCSGRFSLGTLVGAPWALGYVLCRRKRARTRVRNNTC